MFGKGYNQWVSVGKQLKVIVALAICATIIVLLAPKLELAKAETITVPDDFATIQAAMDAANPGDTVFVKAGWYNETITVNRTIALVGENRESVIVDGNGARTVLCVTASGVSICNLTVTGGSPSVLDACGIRVNSSDGILLGNAICGNNWGICFESAHCTAVSSNLLFNNSYGLYSTLSNNLRIERNEISNCSTGVYLSGANYGNVELNTITDCAGSAVLCRDGYECTFTSNILQNDGFGFWLDPTSYSLVANNSILSCRSVGIRMHGYSVSDIFVNNTLVGNGEGFFFHDTARSVISRNLLYENDRAFALYGGSSIGDMRLEFSYNDVVNNTMGVWLTKLQDSSRFSRNNFINNSIHVTSEDPPLVPSIIRWNDTYPNCGNYWSNYSGTDQLGGMAQNETGSDGIGDAPHAVNGKNIDHYPLMAPIKAFDAGTWNNVPYAVEIVSNSTISDFHFDPEEGASFRYSATGEGDTAGFCRVAVPKDLLWTDDGWKIRVDTQSVADFRLYEDANRTYLHFTYTHSSVTVQIEGTYVIPEFSLPALLTALMGPLLLASLARRKARGKESR